MKVKLGICLTLLILQAVFAINNNNNNENIITAYVVPHSHDDVGWLYTIDEYYNMTVQYIYDTVVEELYNDQDKKFISVEMAFFYKWWIQATPEQQDQVRQIVKNNQFEFVSAGWVMQDEACSTFSAGVDQMTEGHQFVLSEFGAIPKAGWQIDPFGATGATASMFALMKFQSHIIDRINYTVTDSMEATQSIEFMWSGISELKSSGEILTHALSENYCQPMEAGFDFESMNQTKNPPITPENIQARSQALVDFILQRSSYYLTNNILVPYGCDFHFHNASAEFENMGQIIDYINANASYGVQLKYTTLSEYFDSILSLKNDNYNNVSFPTRTGGDWGTMPCSANNTEYTYWTGYYTSRNFLKGHIRSAEASLKSFDALYVQGLLDAKLDLNFTQIQSLRRALAESQHHDGVSGTSRYYVVDMYHDHLYEGEADALEVAQQSLGSLLNYETPVQTSNVSSDLQNLQKGQYVPVIVQNSLGWERNEFVKIKVWRDDVVVTDASGDSVAYQINPSLGTDYPFNLFFEVSVSPMGYNTYYVSVGDQVDPSKVGKLVNVTSGFSIVNSLLSVSFNDNFTLSSITNSLGGATANINQMYMQYESQTKSPNNQNSGAYIFVPAGPAQPLPLPNTTQLIQGQYVQEVYQIFNEYVSHTVRLYSGSNWETQIFVEINSTIGVLPENTELIVRYATDLNNYDTNPYTQESVLVHHTDENGYTTVPRYTDYNIVDTLGGNYFPMVMRAELRDQKSHIKFGVVSDRTHGTASYEQGQLEVMLHRRILSDDTQGLAGYPLNDTDIISPVTRLLLGGKGDNDTFGFSMKRQAYFVNFPLVPFYGPVSNSTKEIPVFRYEPLNALPDNIHVMSFKTLDGSNTIILRLQHMCSIKESCSVDVTIDLNNLFTSWKITEIRETSLSANQVISNNASTITLSSMQLRTFLLTLASH